MINGLFTLQASKKTLPILYDFVLMLDGFIGVFAGLSPQICFLLMCLCGLLGMYLIQSRGRYTRLTRTGMDILAAITFASGILSIIAFLSA